MYIYHCTPNYVSLPTLTLLGLYLYIGHKSCNTLSILNKLTLQKDLHNFVTNDVILVMKKKQQHKKKSNIKTLAGARN